MIRKEYWGCNPASKAAGEEDRPFSVIGRDGKDWYIVHAVLIRGTWDEESQTQQYVTVEVPADEYDAAVTGDYPPPDCLVSRDQAFRIMAALGHNQP